MHPPVETTMQSKGPQSTEVLAGAGVASVGLLLIIAGVLGKVHEHTYLGAFLMLVGAFVSVGIKTFKFKSPVLGELDASGGEVKPATIVYYEQSAGILENIQPKELPPELRIERESYLRGREIPGAAAPPLSPSGLALASDLLIRPSAYPMTPMYMLDKYYRIIDWNLAFSLAFDGTMEGRIGHSVLEWTYWLDNYESVFDHGSKVFKDERALPLIDKETIQFTSARYGKLTAVKRAYQIPDDNGDCLAWLATLQLTFVDSYEEQYKTELIRLLGLDQLWTEYATSYDRVLLNTKVYPELIARITGSAPGDGPRKLAPNAVILDLGAGTGNITKLLMEESRQRTILAVEQNRAMLDILRCKCSRYVSEDKQGPGVVIARQDVTSLYGFEDECCDVVIINNVLYSIANYRACLSEAFRVLRPGGELRLSEPRSDTSLDALFGRIASDLQESGKYEEIEADFLRVKEINYFRLKPMLNRWTVEEMKTKVRSVGFSEITYASEDVYAGQSMLLCAVK